MNKRPHLEALEQRLMMAAAPQLTAAQVFAIIQAAASVSIASQTIVVVDRAGDVLGMYGQDPALTAPGGSPDPDTVASNDTANLVEAETQDTAAKYAVIQATARARTTAFFESTQDAFTSRTARFIVQNGFPQGVDNTEAGPLLGVEFSNALGTDVLPPGLTTGLAAGLSGDPGGIPLFINGQPVGAIGVAGDGHDVAARQDLVPPSTTPETPAFNSDPKGTFYNGVEESDFDEAVALAGAKGFMAPAAIQATNIFVNGLRLPFVAEGAATKTDPDAANPLVLTDTGLKPFNTSGLATRTFFAYDPLIGDADYQAGLVANGFSAAPNAVQDSVITGAFADDDTIGGLAISSVYPEVTLPLTSGGSEKVLLDNNSVAAGGYDGPVAATGVLPTAVTRKTGVVTATTPQAFGFVPGAATGGQSLSISDILKVVTQALNQARITRAAIRVPDDVSAGVYIAVTDTQGNILAVVSTIDATDFSFDVAVQKARTAAFFSSDTYAFSSRAVGFLADNTIPPGIKNGVTGPLYQLQETLALPQNQGLFNPDVDGSNPLANGITIFPGGAPLYKDGVLVGAIGISGDGVDQDDLIDAAGTAGFAAPAKLRDSALGAATLKNDLTTIVNNIGNIAGDVFPMIGDAATAGSLVNLGFANPNVPNLDGISVPTTDDILQVILARLAKVGVDSVNLPFQKFPRNPNT